MILNAMYPVIIPIHHNYNSGPIPEEAKQSLIGIFIFLNILWIISLSITTVKYFNTDPRYRSFRRGLDSNSAIAGILDMFMVTFWGIILLFLIGSFIGQLL